MHGLKNVIFDYFSSYNGDVNCGVVVSATAWSLPHFCEVHYQD